MKIEKLEVNKTNSSLTLNKLVDNTIDIKDFVIELFNVCEQIINESGRKFGIIFSKTGTNEYFVIDYRILILALLNYFVKRNVEVYYIENIKNLFPFNDYKKVNNSMIDLMFFLAKHNLVYSSNNIMYFTKYTYCIKGINNNFITKINGIALQYKIILELFSDESNMIDKFNKLKTKDFVSYKDRNRSKSNKYFTIKQFSQFDNYFFNNQ